MKIKLPTGWHQIDVETFIKIRDITTQFVGLERYVEIIDLLSENEFTDDELLEMDIDDFFSLCAKLKWFNTQPPTIVNKTIDGYKFLDLSKMTLGEFIDLESYFANDVFSHLALICAIFWQNDTSTKERAKLFLRKPISEVYGIMVMYMEHRRMILETYKEFFGQEDEEVDDVNVDEMSAEERAEQKKALEAERVHQKWAWEKILWKLSNGDVTKYESILELPLVFVLNQLSFMKDCHL